MDQRDFPAAVTDMSAALALLQACPSLHYQRAMAYYSMQDNEAAKQVWVCMYMCMRMHGVAWLHACIGVCVRMGLCVSHFQLHVMTHDAWVTWEAWGLADQSVGMQEPH